MKRRDFLTAAGTGAVAAAAMPSTLLVTPGKPINISLLFSQLGTMGRWCTSKLKAAGPQPLADCEAIF
ncbi:MAG: hypothetical protein ACI8WM_001727 [Burkholderiaceae bacterium]|jgi:hypothetical protein